MLILTHVHTFIHELTHARLHAYTNACKQNTRVHTHTHTHTHTLTHIHIHTRKSPTARTLGSHIKRGDDSSIINFGSLHSRLRHSKSENSTRALITAY